jgi:predicted ester cyclase
MSAAAQAFIHRWFEEVWDNGNLDHIDEFMLPESKCYDFPTPGSIIDREEFKSSVRGFRDTFSGIRVTVEDVITEGDKVAARWSAVMTHTGDGLGFAATGEPVTLSGMSLTHLRDGKILAGWNAFDLASTVANLRALSASDS